MADRRFNKVAALESDFSINLRYSGQYFDEDYNWRRPHSSIGCIAPMHRLNSANNPLTLHT